MENDPKKPDFFAQITLKDKQERDVVLDAKEALLTFFDKLMNHIQEPVKQGKIARLRAKIEIELRDIL